VLVQTLTLILITTPELAPLRSLLKGLRTNQAGQAFFESLYRSWSHNAVATLALCLLAQAYHHARDLVQILYAPRSRSGRGTGAELAARLTDRTRPPRGGPCPAPTWRPP